MKKTKSKKKTRGAHALRSNHMKLAYHLQAAQDALRLAEANARELGVVDQLAIAVRALRSIANHKSFEARAEGIARGALKRMEVERW